MSKSSNQSEDTSFGEICVFIPFATIIFFALVGIISSIRFLVEEYEDSKEVSTMVETTKAELEDRLHSLERQAAYDKLDRLKAEIEKKPFICMKRTRTATIGDSPFIGKLEAFVGYTESEIPCPK